MNGLFGPGLGRCCAGCDCCNDGSCQGWGEFWNSPYEFDQNWETVGSALIDGDYRSDGGGEASSTRPVESSVSTITAFLGGMVGATVNGQATITLWANPPFSVSVQASWVIENDLSVTTTWKAGGPISYDVVAVTNPNQGKAVALILTEGGFSIEIGSDTFAFDEEPLDGPPTSVAVDVTGGGFVGPVTVRCSIPDDDLAGACLVEVPVIPNAIEWSFCGLPFEDGQEIPYVPEIGGGGPYLTPKGFYPVSNPGPTMQSGPDGAFGCFGPSYSSTIDSEFLTTGTSDSGVAVIFSAPAGDYTLLFNLGLSNTDLWYVGSVSGVFYVGNGDGSISYATTPPGSGLHLLTLVVDEEEAYGGSRIILDGVYLVASGVLWGGVGQGSLSLINVSNGTDDVCVLFAATFDAADQQQVIGDINTYAQDLGILFPQDGLILDENGFVISDESGNALEVE